MLNFFKKILPNSQPDLIKYMPKVCGVLKKDYPLAKLTRFGVGGPAEVFFEPEDIDDLAFFLSKTNGIPIAVIGAGSNLLIRDGGIPNIVIKLGKNFQYIKRANEHSITAGAGAMNFHISRFAMENHIAGLEFLSGIPGGIGGSLKMNAGAMGTDISDIIESAVMMDNFGKQHFVEKEDLIFNYRETTIPSGWIILEITLTGTSGDKDTIAAKMNEMKNKREESQPIHTKTAGSTFKNPEGLSAWRLIDKAGLRGMRIGGAMISTKHSNFIINTGSATAQDIETLGETVRHKVLEMFGIDLQWEIRRMGVKLPSQSTFGGR